MSNYFIYRISQGSANLIKKLEKVDRFDSYRDAKKRVRELRAAQESADQSIFKIIFAASELEAEEILMEKRDAPIVEEWEK